MRRQCFEVNAAAISINERPASCNPRSKSAKTVLKKMYCPENCENHKELHVIANNYLEFKRNKSNRYRRKPKIMWRDVKSGGIRDDLSSREVLQIPKFTFPRLIEFFVKNY